MVKARRLLFSILFLIATDSIAQIWPASLAGRWTFDNLSSLTQATVGNDLVLTGTHAVVPGINGADGAVEIGVGSYYTCTHGIAANGGGTTVNEYSFMFDFRFTDAMAYHCFYQTNMSNTNDGEVFLNPNSQIGISATGYTGHSVPPYTWHRMVISVDLGNTFKYYLDGHLILSGTSQAVDGRFSLDLSGVLFFADENAEDNPIQISQIAVFSAALNDAEVHDLGGLCTSNIRPYLQTPSSTSMFVSWNSYNTASTTVEYGTTAALGSSSSGAYENIGGNFWHTVQLTGLTPGTRYYYHCISGNDTSELYYFRTPVQPATAGGHIRFAIIGDSQTNVWKSAEVADSMISAFENLYGSNWRDSVNIVLHTGDIMGTGSNLGAYMNEYFNPFHKFSAYVPFMVSIGNHVSENMYYYSFVKYEGLSDYAFPNPLNEKFYSFRLGNCQFIAMNTNGTYNNSIQTAWLQEKLNQSDTSSACDFVFAFAHHPGHSELWPDGNTDYVWTDLYGVMKQYEKMVLYFCGHSHNYERGVLQSTHTSGWDFRTMLSGGAGGDLDRWGMYFNQTDYQEIQRSLDYYNYALVDVNMNSKRADMKAFSLGNPDKPMNNILIDQWHRIPGQPAPNTPLCISPAVQAFENATLVASAFSGVDSLMSSEFQIALNTSPWSACVFDSVRDAEDIYGVTPAPFYNPVNINDGINLSQISVPAGYLTVGNTYKWRMRYRDHNVRWSAWSDSLMFTVLPMGTQMTGEVSGGAQLFPNPAADILFIQFDNGKAGQCEIELIDFAGRVVQRIATGYYKAGLQCVKWNRDQKIGGGNYFCRITTAGRVYNLKLLLE